MTPCGRRTFLAAAVRAGAGAGVACLLPAALAGCRNGDADAAAGPVTVPLADIPDGGRVRVVVAGDPVELRRAGDQVFARSLMCTHQGCEIVWQADQDGYVCPCHHGRFDAEGRPVYGPPREPLRDVPVTVEGGEVVIGV